MSARAHNTLIDLAESLVALAKQKGAAQAEVSIVQGRELSIEVLDGEVDSLTEAGSKDLSLRVFVDGRVATATSSDFAKDTLTRLVEGALTRARLGGQDSCAGLPERTSLGAAAVADLHDPALFEMPAERKVAFAKSLESIGLADGRLKKSLGSSFGTYEITRALANSNGFSGAYAKTMAQGYVGFQGGEGDNLIQDGWGDGATRLADLMSAEGIAKKAVERVARLVGARKIETQNVPVIFEPPVAASLLLGFLAQCASGPALARKQSFLCDKLGTSIGNPAVNIVDDALLAGGRGSRPFDGEGVAARRTSVVEQGVLKSFVLDTYYGRKLKLASTGHAGGLSNLYWQKGETSPAAMVKSLERGLLLTGTLGQGTVPTTGDISIGAFGLWIEKGEIAYPVAEVTISGNLGELLQRVEMVGSDLELRRSVAAPSIKIGEMSIAGKASTATKR